MNENKPNIFSRVKTRLTRWFREMRSELKKVVWPTRKQLVNNTMIVLVALLVVGAVIAALDAVFLFAVHKALPAAVDFFRG